MRYTVYLTVFLATMAVGAYVTTYNLVRGQPEVTAPDLQGMEAVTALKVLSDSGLILKVEGSDYSRSVPTNHIITQNPAPGLRVKAGREIRVTLSQGPANLTMPDVRGMELEQARAMLGHGRLTPGRLTRVYSAGPEQGRGRVLAQSPAALSETQPGSRVDLLVSLGPRPEYLVMPDLTGQPYSLAVLRLEKMGLTSGGPVEAEYRPSWPEGAVLVQSPPPGDRVAKGQPCRLTVNHLAVSSGEYRLKLIEYQTPFGLFDREISIRVSLGGRVHEIYRRWHGPGRRVRVLTLLEERSKVQIFEDGIEQPAAEDRFDKGASG